LKQKISGFSFKKLKSGEAVGVEGKKILPHRVDLISQFMNEKKDVSDMFFNFNVADCINESNMEQIYAESELLETWESSL